MSDDVIVANHDHIMRDVLRSILDIDGFNVLLAVDGLEAVDYATRTLAQLVILDMNMPKLDGLAAYGQIRRLSGYASVPIVILTSSDDEKLRSAAPFAGPTTLIAKPFSTTDLERKIALLLGPVGTVSRAPEPVAFVWKRHVALPPLDGEPTELSEGRRVLNICRPLNGPRRY
jgi:DNA-binding response OmpR family regulator